MPKIKQIKELKHFPTEDEELKNEVIEEAVNDEDDDEIEIIVNKKMQKEKVVKEKVLKEKKPYVLTDARKAQFEKAREIRMSRVNEKKQEEEEKKQEFYNRKKQLEELRMKKQKKKEDEELQMMQAELNKDDSDEEVIIMKKQKKRKVYVEAVKEKIAPTVASAPLPPRLIDRRMLYC